MCSLKSDWLYLLIKYFSEFLKQFSAYEKFENSANRTYYNIHLTRIEQFNNNKQAKLNGKAVKWYWLIHAL